MKVHKQFRDAGPVIATLAEYLAERVKPGHRVRHALATIRGVEYPVLMVNNGIDRSVSARCIEFVFRDDRVLVRLWITHATAECQEIYYVVPDLFRKLRSALAEL